MLECRWILSRLHATCATADAGLEAYEFSATTQAIYAFWKEDVCDAFIELIKPIVRVRVPFLTTCCLYLCFRACKHQAGHIFRVRSSLLEPVAYNLITVN